MECSICLNAISSTDKSFKTDCKHCFHEQCIKGWIEHDKKTCPNCRHPINQNLLDELNITTQTNDINTKSPEFQRLIQRLGNFMEGNFDVRYDDVNYEDNDDNDSFPSSEEFDD
jgi:hypothetical protein